MHQPSSRANRLISRYHQDGDPTRITTNIESCNLYHEVEDSHSTAISQQPSPMAIHTRTSLSNLEDRHSESLSDEPSHLGTGSSVQKEYGKLLEFESALNALDTMQLNDSQATSSLAMSPRSERRWPDILLSGKDLRATHTPAVQRHLKEIMDGVPNKLTTIAFSQVYFETLPYNMRWSCEHRAA